MKIWIALMLFVIGGALQAGVEIRSFDKAEQEQRFKVLINELRCLVCQNQNLADSDADLAKDLRAQIFEMINAGKSDEEIIAYMVQRYGDFVLYKPPLKSSTLVLWVGPFLLFVIGVIVLMLVIRRQNKQVPDLNEDEHNTAQHLLQENSKDKQS